MRARPKNAKRRPCAVLTAAMLGCLAWLCGAPGAAAVQAIDDVGITVVLQAPARRIVSLAPHTTELLFAAGAGERIVGTTDFSDYPDAAQRIPRIGSSTLLDLERVVSLNPDLIVVWLSGGSAAQLARIRALGVPVFHSEPRTLADIPSALERLGVLAGTPAEAQKAAAAFSARAAALRARYANRSPVPLFWQVWARPLLTVNGRHIISDVVGLCGGRNLFAALSPLVPPVSVEAVIEADPEAIVTTSNDATPRGDEGLEIWRALPKLRATARGNLVALRAETIHRQSPRILDGAAALCERLEEVRARRPR